MEVGGEGALVMRKGTAYTFSVIAVLLDTQVLVLHPFTSLAGKGLHSITRYLNSLGVEGKSQI